MVEKNLKKKFNIFNHQEIANQNNLESPPHEKEMQRALIQYRDPKNRALVAEALRLAGREDLIGYGPKCLLRPERRERLSAAQPKKGRKDGKAHGGKKKTIRNIHRKKQNRQE